MPPWARRVLPSPRAALVTTTTGPALGGREGEEAAGDAAADDDHRVSVGYADAICCPPDGNWPPNWRQRDNSARRRTVGPTSSEVDDVRSLDCRAVSIRVSPRLEAIPRYEPGLTTAEVLARFGLERAVKLASNESPFPPMPEVAEVITAGHRRPQPLPRRPGARPAAGAGGAPRGGPGRGGDRQRLVRADPLRGPGAARPGDERRARRPVVRALPAPRRGGRARAPCRCRWRPTSATTSTRWRRRWTRRTRLVIVCNPNNPTGVYRSADEIERFVDALPEDLAILVDEAYFDFVDRPDAGRTMSLARERPNLLVTRTFSKAHGLCGLRVGYGVGGSGWIAAIDKVRQPFNTNALAQARRAGEPAAPARPGPPGPGGRRRACPG